MRKSALFVVLVVLASACFSDGAPSETTRSTGGPSTVPADSTTTTLDPRPCRTTTVIAPARSGGQPVIARVPSGNAHAAAAAVAQAAFECASDAVVVDTLDLDRVALGAVLAAGLQAPLLFGDPDASSLVAYELDRLAPERVFIVGDSAVAPSPEWTEVTRITGSLDEIAADISARIGASGEPVAIPAFHGIDTVAAAMEAIATGRPLQTSTVDPGSATPVKAEDLEIGTAASGMVWLVDRNEHAAALAAAAGAATSDGYMTLVRGEDLRQSIETADRLAPFADSVANVQVIGGTADAEWQARVLLRNDQLPGGGFLMFPGRRLVALYGNPLTTSLGVLGEQDPQAGAQRIATLSQGYGADGLQVIPSFEIIATVAAGNAGGDGNYSNEMELDLLRGWVEVAEANDMYVLLDLQPGRSHFLDQAKLYEELLLHPHVGLALDPEWRLEPNQLPLQQIGGVDASEVNEVVDWLAALVRDNGLPQKVLLLHQFIPTMLRDRDQIKATPELSLVIQMDGQGVIETKYGTWARTTDGWENSQFLFGWKNFFDEDVPGPVGPTEILDLVPTAVYVSYQ